MMTSLLKPICALFTMVIVLASCNTATTGNNNTIPACLEGKIAEIKKEEVINPPTEIWAWAVDGKTYYYITSECCDNFNYLYDDQCKQVCAPDGGFTGNGDGKCPEFKGEIKKTLVWKDNRK